MPSMEENVIKRILPHSLEAEQAVIGSMLMDTEAVTVVAEILTKNDFYSKQYGILFETMVEMNEQGQAIDPVTLQNRLKEKDVPPEVSSLEFVRELLLATYTSANVAAHAKIVAEKAMLRRMIQLNEEIANTCYAGKESLEFIMDDTEKKMFQRI